MHISTENQALPNTQVDQRVEDQVTLYLSNQMEELLKQLHKNLFHANSSPFAERLIIIPSTPMEEWIRKESAEALGVCTGLQFLFLQQGVSYCLKEFFQEMHAPLLARQELLLLLFAEIEEIAKEYPTLSSEEQQLFYPCLHYARLLKGEEAAPHRLFELCETLSTLFHKYGIYAEAMTRQWQKRAPQEWQEGLWQRLYIRKKLGVPQHQALQEAHLLQKKSPSPERSLHLFALSHLCEKHFDFFRRVGQRVPLFIYHLSPSMLYWGDLMTPRQTYHLLNKMEKSAAAQELIENELTSSHPLLALLGTLGRKSALLFKEEQCQIHPLYRPPAQNRESLSYLEALQMDMLLLRHPEEESPFPLSNERSIQFHLSTSPQREIENLKQTLLALIKEAQERGETLDPQDILVMAPDILPYAPFIELHFKEPLPCRIMDIPLKRSSQEIVGLFSLLELPQKRWSSRAFLTLLGSPLFQKKQGFSAEDIKQIEQWIREADIRWGLHVKNRNDLLAKEFALKEMQDGGGSWEEGFKRLVRALLSFEEIESVDFVQAPLLGKLMALLRALELDLEPLHAEERKTMRDWSCYILDLLEVYFVESEGEERLDLAKKLEALCFTASEREFPYSFFFALLKNLCETEMTTLNGHHLQAVSFCSLLPLRAIPAKVVCLLGMNHGIFPRKEETAALDASKDFPECDYFPSRPDFDRYLFLEAILSARTHFILSALSVGADGTALPPSLLVTELLNVLKTYEKLEGKCVPQIVHPTDSFDTRYFEPSSGLVNFSQRDFRIAQTLSTTEPRGAFFADLSAVIGEKTPEEGFYKVTLEELQRTLRQPLLPLLRGLGMRFHEAKRLKEEEEFLLSSLHWHRLKSALLRSTPAQILSPKPTDFPLGYFADFATYQINREHQIVQENLRAHQIGAKDLILLELSSSVNALERVAEDHILLPALQFSLSPECRVQISGKIGFGSPQGFVSVEKKSLRGLLAGWPHYLVAQKIAPLLSKLCLKKWIFSKSGEQCDCFFSEADLYLKPLLHFYFQAQRHPLPLLPEWIEPLLADDLSYLTQAIALTLSEETYDKSLLWVFGGAPPRAEEVKKCVGKWAETLYRDLYDAWL